MAPNQAMGEAEASKEKDSTRRSKKKDATEELEPKALDKRTLDMVVEEVGPVEAPGATALSEGLATPKVLRVTINGGALAHNQDGAIGGQAAQPLGTMLEEVGLEEAHNVAAPDEGIVAPTYL